MAKILDLTIVEGGLTVRYRVGGDIRSAWLSDTDIAELTAAQIKALAQSRADSDTGADCRRCHRRLDVMPDPIRETRQWFAANPAIRAFFEQTPDEIDADIDAITLLVQLKGILKGCSIIARAYGLLEIAD